MSDHDPLCPPWAGIPFGECRVCDLIARVREDERGRADSEGFLSPIGSTTGSGQVTGIIGKAFYDAGRIDALDAAREAVEEVPQWYSDNTKGDDGSFAAECLVEDVLAAIDALREEQK